MSLRIASINDLDEVYGMAKKFIATTDYKDIYEETALRNLCSAILSSDGSSSICIIHEGNGFIAGMVAPLIFGNKRLATEIGWWVEPDKRKSNVGKELIEAFEYWAKTVQCDQIVMISLDDDLGKYYEKRGYHLHERAYMKAV